MFNTKRKRAVVLALIAFFCGATAVVAVDWKRFGGGFLAFFKPRSEPVMAYAGSGAPAGGAILTAMADSHPGAAPPTQLAAPSTHRHTSSVGGGSGGHKSDDDLFKYGDPAAGIPAGSFVVAQNDPPGGGGNAGGGAAPSIPGISAPDTSVTAPTGGDTGGGVSSPAPAPTDGGTGDGGIVVKTPTPSPSPSPGTPTPSPAPPPVISPPTPSTPAPAPTPTQSGTSDQDPGNGGGDTPAPPPPVVVPPTPPVSAVPEASNAAMMGLGALFLAVAALRRRQNGQG